MTSGLRSGEVLSRTPGDLETSALSGAVTDSDRRSSDSVSQLSRRLNEKLTQAVDPLQVAAFLEAEGLNDRLVRERYGYPDVFALALEIYQRVPLRVQVAPRPSSLRSPWIAVSYILRGLIYALPGLFYVALAPVMNAEALIYVVIPALIFAWGWNQASTYIGFNLLGRRHVSGAMRFSRRSMAIGTLATLMMALTVSLLLLGNGWAAILAAAQAAYLLASATLLLFRRDEILAIGLVPGVLVSLPVAAGVTFPIETVVSILSLTLVIVVAGAWYVTRVDQAFPAIGLRASDMMSSLPYMALGLIWSSTLAVSFVVSSGLGDGINVTLPVLPLILSMGIAEWQAKWLIDRSHGYLKVTSDLRQFRHLAWRAFGRSLGIYLVGLVALSGIAMSIDLLTGVLESAEALLFLAYGALGVAFFAGLALVAVSRVHVVMGLSAFMLGLFGLGYFMLNGSAGTVLGLYSVVTLLLAAALLGVSRTYLPNGLAHR